MRVTNNQKADNPSTVTVVGNTDSENVISLLTTTSTSF